MLYENVYLLEWDRGDIVNFLVRSHKISRNRVQESVTSAAEWARLFYGPYKSIAGAQAKNMGYFRSLAGVLRQNEAFPMEDSVPVDVEIDLGNPCYGAEWVLKVLLAVPPAQLKTRLRRWLRNSVPLPLQFHALPSRSSRLLLL